MTNAALTKPAYLSDEYWGRLEESNKALYHLIRPMPEAAYTVDVGLMHLEEFLAGQERDMTEMGGSVELDPDFQRGHVWTDLQRSLYMESFIRGQAPNEIRFNCPSWTRNSVPGDIPAYTFQCVDGLQRLTTIRMFMRGEVLIFGGLTNQDLARSAFDTRRMRIKVAVYEFAERVDLLSFYLSLNIGGTPHSAEEIERVKGLLAKALESEKKK